MDIKETSLFQQAMQTIRQHHMLVIGDRLTVGVSGGADSVALLTFLLNIASEYQLTLQVCHINHGLRGCESDGDAEFVRSLADRNGLPYYEHTLQADEEAQKAGLGVEEYSRNQRYAFFEQVAGKTGKVVTAHTLSDSIETVLFHLTRGSGAKGLCGIPYTRGNILRPLRDCTREQVEEFLKVVGIAYRTDSTNATDDYSRNFIRHHVVPELQQLNPAVHLAINNLSQQLNDQCKLIEELVKKTLDSTRNPSGFLTRQVLLNQQKPIMSGMLKLLLAENDVQVSSKTIVLMQKVCEKGSGAVELKKGLRLRANNDYVWVEKEPEVIQTFHIEIDLPILGQAITFPIYGTKSLKIQSFVKENLQNLQKFNNKDLNNLLIYDKIKEPVFISAPTDNDQIFKQGRMHSLNRLYRLGNRGLSKGEISRMVVLRDANGILWAERLGVNESRKSETGKFIYLVDVLED